MHKYSLKNSLKQTFFLCLITIIFFIVESNEFIIENYYYKGFYPNISKVLRLIFNSFSINFGDIFYLIFFYFLLVKTLIFLKHFYKSNEKKTLLKKATIKCINFSLIIFITFKLIWGFNYSRLGVAKQFKITKFEYKSKDLEKLLLQAIFSANDLRKSISNKELNNVDFNYINSNTKIAYQQISANLPYLSVKYFNIKKGLTTNQFKYLGCTGYYNPFTGEANVRPDLPKTLLPLVACHEVAHQIGYANEDEADFIAYLVANESNNLIFNYSFLVDLIRTAQQELLKCYLAEEIQNPFAKIFNLLDCRSIEVKKDMQDIRHFFIKDDTKLSKATSDFQSYLFDKYLKINYSKKGIQSYNQSLCWLLSYQKKYKQNN